MDAELQMHLELEAEALVARGIDPREARLDAQHRFGSLAHIKDECRDSWGVRAIAVAQDARDAVRALRRYPGYTAIVLLALALGIGANTAIFSVVHAVLLRPLPYANGDRIVELRQQAPRFGLDSAGLSVQELADYRSQTPSLDAIVEYHQMAFNLLGRGDASRVLTGVVSTDFFDVLGVAPLVGRTFRPEDNANDAPAVLILSHAYWQRALGSDPAIVGRRFEMNDRAHTVIGVLPAMPASPASCRSRSVSGRRRSGCGWRGAPPTSVVGMIVGQGLKPVAIGLALGLAGALLMTRLGANLLFAIEPTDPPTYALVVATLAFVAALACLGPASRAAAIDPMCALRAD